MLSGGGERFSCAGRTLISPGFTAAMPWLAVKDESLPPFTVGETVPIGDVELYQVCCLVVLCHSALRIVMSSVAVGVLTVTCLRSCTTGTNCSA